MREAVIEAAPASASSAIATTILPMAAAASLLDVPPAGAPKLEFHTQNERPETSGKPRALRTFDLIDLSYYGKPRTTPFLTSPWPSQFPLGYPENRSRCSCTKR